MCHPGPPHLQPTSVVKSDAGDIGVTGMAFAIDDPNMTPAARAMDARSFISISCSELMAAFKDIATEHKMKARATHSSQFWQASKVAMHATVGLDLHTKERARST